MYCLMRTAVAAACLFLPLHAHAALTARIEGIERIADANPAQALSMFDRLANEVEKGKLADRQKVRAATCWLLSYTEPAKALELTRRAGTEADAMLHLCRGYAFEQLKQAEKALSDYEAAVEAGRRLGDERILARALALRGEQRYARGLYADAIDDLKASYDIASRLRKKKDQDYALNALANLYADRNVREFDAALECYKTLLRGHEQRGNQQGMATAHFNMASTYESKGELGAARLHFEKALQLDTARGVAADIAADQRAYAVVLSKLGEHANSLSLLDKALSASTEDASMAMLIRLSRGAAWRRAGAYARAIVDLDDARRFFESPRNERYLQKVFEELSLTRAAMGDWRGAYAAQASMIAAQSAIQQQMLDERTSRLRVQFQSEQARLRNVQLQYQNSMQEVELANTRAVRQWQLAALGVSLILIGLLAAFGLRQRQFGKQMHSLALTDELTRLPNRRHLMSQARNALSQARAGHTRMALAALDIDHFKRINDRYGHAVGDLVLQRVAHALAGALRSGDAIGRTGGEEFVAILRDAGELDAQRAAERLRTAVAGLDCTGLPTGLSPTISVGVAEYRPSDETIDPFLQRADEALYRAKEYGRNRVELAAA